MISLNSGAPQPIYEQIKDQLRRLILTGVMKEEEKLPSVRDLAAGLQINPNTIQRAYRELEAEGYIYSLPGKGSFVSKKPDAAETRRSELKGKLKLLLEELKIAGASEEEIAAVVHTAFEEREGAK